MKTGAELIAKERARQIEKEGWTPEHDDEHTDGSLAVAATCYALHATERGWTYRDMSAAYYQHDQMRSDWPWQKRDWKPKDPLRDLVRAGALIAAEIDRLQRIK